MDFEWATSMDFATIMQWDWTYFSGAKKHMDFSKYNTHGSQNAQQADMSFRLNLTPLTKGLTKIGEKYTFLV